MRFKDEINPVWCFKGGGGSSGRVDYPAYLKDMHSQMLCGEDADSAVPAISDGNALDDIIDGAIGNSPFSGFTLSIFDPDTASFPSVQNIESAISALDTFVSSVDADSWDTDIWDQVFAKLSEIWVVESWETFTLDAATDISGLLSSPDAPSDISGMTVGSDVDDAVDAFADVMDAQLTEDVYPRFEAGMRDINAVVSSAFAIGRANIEEGRNRQVADYDGKLRHQATLNQQSKEMDAHIQADQINAQGDELLAKAHIQEDQLNAQDASVKNQLKISEASGRAQSLMSGASEILKMLELEIGLQKTLASVQSEGNRLGIVAKKEEADAETQLAMKDEFWDLEVMEKGGNVIASIAGASTVRHGEDSNKMQSAIGGAMSGAAAGAPLGPPGMIAGGVLGAAAGMMG